jgi:hypothetical protein
LQCTTLACSWHEEGVLQQLLRGAALVWRHLQALLNEIQLMLIKDLCICFSHLGLVGNIQGLRLLYSADKLG